MSPNALNPNDILKDDNYFLWEFNARMALARKDLLHHIELKPEDAMHRNSSEWKSADMKALAVLSKLLSPTYQSMIREATSALEAWETLPADYDAMVRIIENRDTIGLLEAKEMLRREFECLQKREKKEEAFKATFREHGKRNAGGRVDGARGNANGRMRRGPKGGSGRTDGKSKGAFTGQCFQSAHIVNRIPNTARPNASPFEILTGSKPALDYLRVFGARGYAEAMASPDAAQWKEAIRSEIKSHIRNHTWDMVMRPRDGRVIDSKWVFARKYDEHGNIARYKARLVARGYLQMRGVDYMETYSPVASMNTIPQDGMVCKLRRSLYGLKQAANVWFKTIRAAFKRMGFEQCRADPCLFVHHNDDANDGASPVYVVLYVDDLLVGCKTDAQAESVRAGLAAQFTVKSLGDARLVLGMEIDYNRDQGELMIKQSQYITKMVERFGQADAHAVHNPLVFDLSPADEHARLANKTQYRELIGALLYVANATRPDISMAVSALSRYLEEPRELHWRAAVRVLRYLKGTASMGIKYKQSKSGGINMVTYCDANWGGDKETRRSTSGVIIMLGGGPVVYRSKRQATVSLSWA
ncbi:hypothetical protein P43SY_006190 [Pythium insidiosum]|uniref:Reverse transcriptase Ty1/copia-type domain-containing protein n=1 Tax=Pythium insidiosum TaxID=114742 RepID=A0AAD5LTZ2_PYTIN|nr:hypothetical protein P43SY_006190 [Pythium insidiosum]